MSELIDTKMTSSYWPQYDFGGASTVAATATAVSVTTTTVSQGLTIAQGVMKWVYVSVGVLGLVNNLFTMVTVAKSRILRPQPRNWFIFHQSLADFISAIFIVATVTRTASPLPAGLGGAIICVIWSTNFAYNLTTYASTYILAAFTIEVYMATVHPITHKRVFSHRLVAVIVAIAWLPGIIYCCAVYCQSAKVVNGLCYVGYGYAPIALVATVSNFILRMILPSACYAVSYILIAYSLRSRISRINPASSQPTTSSTTKELATSGTNKKRGAVGGRYEKVRLNITITVFYTLVIHVLSWLGQQIIVFMSLFGYKIVPTGALFQLLQLATYISSSVNPIIYIIKYDKFRQASKSYLCCWRWSRASGDSQYTGNSLTQEHQHKTTVA